MKLQIAVDLKDIGRAFVTRSELVDSIDIIIDGFYELSGRIPEDIEDQVLQVQDEIRSAFRYAPQNREEESQ